MYIYIQLHIFFYAPSKEKKEIQRICIYIYIVYFVGKRRIFSDIEAIHWRRYVRIVW